MWSIVFRAKSILPAGEQFAKPTTKSIMNGSHILKRKQKRTKTKKKDNNKAS